MNDETPTLATENVQPDPADERWFVVDEEAFNGLLERLDQPAKAKPRLAALLREKNHD